MVKDQDRGQGSAVQENVVGGVWRLSQNRFRNHQMSARADWKKLGDALDQWQDDYFKPVHALPKHVRGKSPRFHAASIGPHRGTRETGRKPPTISGFEFASKCHHLIHDNRNLTVANDFIRIGV